MTCINQLISFACCSLCPRAFFEVEKGPCSSKLSMEDSIVKTSEAFELVLE